MTRKEILYSSMIAKRFNCTGFGFRVPFTRWKLEVWFCPSNVEIPDHTHPNIDSILCLLFGTMQWRMGIKSRIITGLLRKSSGVFKLNVWKVPHYQTHGASVLGKFAVFANIEYWHTDKISSAATDLILTKV